MPGAAGRKRIVLRETMRGVLRRINYADPLVKYRGSKVVRLTRILSDREDIGLSLPMAIDIFYTFYLPAPVLEERHRLPRSLWFQHRVIDTLLSGSFIHDIRSKTVVDGLMSSIAASVFLTELRSELERNIEYGRGRRQARTLEELREEVTEEDLKKSVEKAMANTMRDVENAKKIRSIIEGEQPGNVSMMAYEEYAPELIKLARNTEVIKILEILAGFKPWTVNIPERRRRSKHGEITGYELGKEIERLVPSVLALPDEVFYLRFLEGRLLLYQKLLSQGKGPLYVLIDKSGSMDGTKIIWAKAVALSLYMRSLREHREFYLRFFDSAPYPLARVDKRPKVRQALKLMEYIARVKGSGGTDISKAILLACNDIRSGSVREISDIVLITDGVDRIAEQVVSYNLKKSNARLITVMIMGDNKSLRKISTKYLTVKRLSREDMLKVVEA